MKKAFALMLAIGVASGQDKKQDLVLVSREVKLMVHENMAIARVVIKVKNPGEKALEGDVSFEAPVGAAVCEATLLKHIASTERRSKLLAPDEAATLYTAVRDRELDEEERRKLDRAIAATGTTTLSSGGTSTMVQDILIRRKGGGTTTTTGPNRGTPPTTPTRPPSEPNQPTRPGDSPPTTPDDPALLEHVSGDSYRLRFFPVPGGDDQTVSFLMAWELPKEQDKYIVRLPLDYTTNFVKNGRSAYGFQVTLKSSGAKIQVSCDTHYLSADGRAEGGANDKEFVLRVGLAADAKLHDFTRRVDWSKTRSAHKEFTVDDAEIAVIARKSIDTGDAKQISASAGIVSKHASLLVIERSVAREVAREVKSNSGADELKAKAALKKYEHAILSYSGVKSVAVDGGSIRVAVATAEDGADLKSLLGSTLDGVRVEYVVEK